MSDNTIRDQLTAILRDRENWHPDDLADAVDAILREFLVVPRSDLSTEFGIHFRGLVFDGMRTAEVARRRAMNVYDLTPAAVRSRQVWKSPWAPLSGDVPDGS
ncbi:hypothetical protein ACWCW7_34415 [Nocardia tengchongensis]